MQMIKLNEATAARRRVPVALVDDTDGITPETGITLSAGDMKISKNGGAEANHAGTLTELAGGDYFYEFAAGEVDSAGYITGRIVKTGVRTFRIAAQVVAFDPYGPIDANVTQEAGVSLADPVGALIARGIFDAGTAQGVTASTLQRRSGGPTFGTNALAGGVVYVFSATTGAGQARGIASNTADTVTLTDNWTITPTGTVKYAIFAAPPASVAQPIDVNVEKVNGVSIIGTGAVGDLFRVA